MEEKSRGPDLDKYISPDKKKQYVTYMLFTTLNDAPFFTLNGGVFA